MPLLGQLNSGRKPQLSINHERHYFAMDSGDPQFSELNAQAHPPTRLRCWPLTRGVCCMKPSQARAEELVCSDTNAPRR